MYQHIDFTSASVETTVRQVAQFVAVTDRNPAGAPINVAFVEDIPITERLSAISALSAAGLQVRPTISARRINSESQLVELLQGITNEAEIDQLLVVGGDPTQPAGPYATALELIESIPIAESAVKFMGLPGLPKEHPTTSAEVLLNSLVNKVEAIQATGRQVELTTQLCLDPAAVHAWISKVRARGVTAPIRIGIPAPTTAAKLLRFCQLCKVDARLEDLYRYGWVADASATLAAPAAFLNLLSQLLQPGDGPISTHVYPMGDVPAALAWWSSIQD